MYKNGINDIAANIWNMQSCLCWWINHLYNFWAVWIQLIIFFYSFPSQQHEISGRALLRVTDNSLQRMGIDNNRDREAIWREIVKQRLKTDIMEIRDMEFMNIYYD